MKIKPLTLGIALGTVLITSPVSASSGEDQHFAGVFFGATSLDSNTDFSYGLEYEYMFSKRWGVGAVYERTDNAHQGDGTEVLLASAYIHPYQKFKLLRIGVGFGQEKIGGSSSHTENISRVSISIDYHVAGFYVVPTLAADFVDGDTATVFGVAFMKSF